jgi:hypothetical protein
MENDWRPRNSRPLLGQQTSGNTPEQALDPNRRLLLKASVGAAAGNLLRGLGGSVLARSAALIGAGGAATAAFAASRTFSHPGMLHTEADFTRMREKVNAGEQPWLDGWNKLISDGYSQLGGTPPRPLDTVWRAAGNNNTAQLYIDIHRAYQLAVRWKVSQNTAYAEEAIKYLNAWSSTLTNVNGNADRYLAAGIYGYQFANVGEIMRGYSGWASADFARFQQMLLNVFYPLSSRFLREHNDAEITNYWANWDQCAIACILATGILCDREDIYNEALDYYKYGAGMGAALNAVYYVHPGNLGQWQESSRDGGHCTLGISLAAAFCEMAWNQGDDMYGYDNNRFLAGAEYVAKSNLLDSSGAFYTMPWFTYNNRHGWAYGVSPAGLGSIRPTWELVHNHYAMRKGIATPYVRKQVDQLYPEGNDRTGDQLGFGTLLFSRDLEASTLKPTGLTAHRRADKVVLSWWGVVEADSYVVKRATSASGPFSTVASGVSDRLTWEDTSITGNSTLYYTVSAIVDGAAGTASDAVRVDVAPQLVFHLPFNEGSGSSAADTTGNRTAQLTGGTAWSAGVQGSAVALDGVDGHLQLPESAIAGLADFTIASRIYADQVRAWARVFDFGSGTRRWMMLTVASEDGRPMFRMTTTHGYNQQQIRSNIALPAGQWTHIAVTLSGDVCTLYINGNVVGSGTGFTLAPSDLGPATSSYLGRSQFGADAYLKARYDDFRIWNGALTAEQIAALV